MITLCSLSGIAGWAVWTLVLNGNLGQDWIMFHTVVRPRFDGDLSRIYNRTYLMGTINQRHSDWLSSPLKFQRWLRPPHSLLMLLPFGTISLPASHILFVSVGFC